MPASVPATKGLTDARDGDEDREEPTVDDGNADVPLWRSRRVDDRRLQQHHPQAPMELTHSLPWVLTLFTCLNLWMVGQRDRRGFLVGLAAQPIWLVFDWYVGAYGLMPLALVLVWLYVRGWRKWAPPAPVLHEVEYGVSCAADGFCDRPRGHDGAHGAWVARTA